MKESTAELSIGKRLQLARENLASKLGRKISQEDLARLCGWESQGRISHYENDRRAPRGEDLVILSKALLVSPDWILFGTNEPFKASADRLSAFIHVPLLEWELVAKALETNSFTSEIYFPSSQAVSKNSFALKVENDSMSSLTYPSFPEGTVIIVDPNATPKHRSFILYNTPDEAYPDFKQLIIERNNCYLKILNPTYPDVIIPAPKGMTILGKIEEALMTLK